MNQCAVYANQGPVHYGFNVDTAVAMYNKPEYFVDASMQGTFDRFTSCSAANAIFTQLLNRVQGIFKAVGLEGLGLHISKPQISSVNYNSPGNDFLKNNVYQLAERNLARVKTWSNPDFMRSILKREDLAQHKVEVALETAVTYNPLNSEFTTKDRMLKELATQLVFLKEAGDVAVEASNLADAAKTFIESFFEEKIHPILNIPYKEFVGIDLKSEKFVRAFKEAFSQFALPCVALYEKVANVPQAVSSLFEDCRDSWSMNSPVAVEEKTLIDRTQLQDLGNKIENAIIKSQLDLEDVNLQDPSNFKEAVRVFSKNFLMELEGKEELSEEKEVLVELLECLSELSLLQDSGEASSKYMSCFADFQNKMGEIQKKRAQEFFQNFDKMFEEVFAEAIKNAEAAKNSEGSYSAPSSSTVVKLNSASKNNSSEYVRE